MTANPRTYWTGLADAELINARDEYRDYTDPFLLRIADDIDDEIVRRADFRRRAMEGVR